MMMNRILVLAALKLQLLLVVVLLPAAVHGSSNGHVDDPDAHTPIVPLPDNLVWERDFDTLEGSQSIYAGTCTRVRVCMCFCINVAYGWE